jgi:hypothetical protein
VRAEGGAPGSCGGERFQAVMTACMMGIAVSLACSACSGATSSAASTAPPTAQVSGAPPPAPLPITPTTAPPSTQPAATPTLIGIVLATSTTSPEVADNAAAAPTSAGATPDRPFGARTKDGGCTTHDALPDSACTPGAIFPDVTADQVCQRGYSASVRNVPAAVSREVYREYGIVERTPGEYEVDHSLALEDGGSNDIANLWPEEYEK